MITGYAHFTNIPEMVTADKLFFLGYGFRNLDKIVTIFVNVTDEFKCVVCGDESLNYTSKSSLAKHIRYHARATVEFWLKHFISKTPEELESILYHKNFKGDIE